MKVLFVSSGNSSKFEIAPFIKAQGEDLKQIGVEVDFFPIKGKGVKGYLKNIRPLRKLIKEKNYDLIHAHYVLSAWVALLTFSGKKVIASFMGSDTYGDVDENGKRKVGSYKEIILAKLIQPFLVKIIVKSKNLEEYIYLKKKCIILPNGVNLEKFVIEDQKKAREELGLLSHKKYILFLGDKNNTRKNFKLLEDAFKLIKSDNFELLSPYPISHEKVVKYMNAADVLAFTSYLEGSPNVVKEAMACNIPIVTVEVGDTIWLIENSQGNILSEKGIDSFANALLKALNVSHRTQSRSDIIRLSLDSKSVANKLHKIYETVLM